MAWTPRSNQSSQQLAPLRHGQHATALTSRPYSPQRWLLTPDSAPVACRSEAREARSRTRATGTCCRAALAPAVAAAVLRRPAAQAPARSPPAAARGHSGTVRASSILRCLHAAAGGPGPHARPARRSSEPRACGRRRAAAVDEAQAGPGVRILRHRSRGAKGCLVCGGYCSGVLVLGQGRPPVSSCWVPWQMTWRLMWTCVALGFWLGCAWFLGVEGCRLLSLTTCGCNTGGRRD
eukprot:COSAG03_NODE_2558_length_2648_cov_1.307179_4_plen_236_part_00